MMNSGLPHSKVNNTIVIGDNINLHKRCYIHLT